MSESMDLVDRPRKRRFRFSLRTGFVVLTVLCLFLGWIFHGIQSNRRQEELIRSLTAYGYRFKLERIESKNALSAAAWLDLFDSRYLQQVIVVYCPNDSPNPDQLRTLSEFEYLCEFSLGRSDKPLMLTSESLQAICDLSKLEFLSLYGVQLPSDISADFARLKSLQVLNLEASSCNDELLSAVARAENLSYLILKNCKISDQGVVHLSRVPHLRRLDLSRTAITDVGLTQLSAVHKLEQLDVRHTKITDAGLTKLQSDLPRLTVANSENSSKRERPNAVQLKKLTNFDLSGEFTTDCSLTWLRPATELQVLNLMDSRVTNHGIQELSGFAKLISVDLRGTPVTDQALDVIVKLPRLRSLLIGSHVTDAGVEKLSGIKTLTFLSLSGTEISDAGLKHLSGLPALERCWLTVPKARGDGYAFLASLDHLESLWLHETTVTKEIAANVAKAPALRVFELIRGKIDGDAMRELTAATKIKHLSFFASEVDSSALPVLSAIPSLESVSFFSCNLKQEDAQRLLAERSELRVLMRNSDGLAVQVR